MSLHTWRHQGPPKSSSCATFMLNTPGAEMPQAKKPCAYVHRVASKCLTHRDPVDCDLPGFSVREESSPGKNAGAYWPILVAMPF